MRFFEDGSSLYIEALPAFDVLRADKQMRAGKRYIHWLSETGVQIGGGEVQAMPGRLLLDYGFITAGMVSTAVGKIVLSVTRRITLDGYARPSVICLGCGKDKRILLIAKRKWKCSSCHGIGHRSKLMVQSSRDFMKIEELRVQLLNGRPKGMHNSTYVARKAKLDQLQSREYYVPPSLPAASLRFQVDAMWSDVKAMPDGIGRLEYSQRDDPEAVRNAKLPKRMIVPLLPKDGW